MATTTGTFRYQFDCSNAVTSTDISNNLPISNTNNSITIGTITVVEDPSNTYTISIPYSYTSTVTSTSGVNFNTTTAIFRYYNNTGGTSKVSNLKILDLDNIPLSSSGSQFATLTTLTQFTSGKQSSATILTAMFNGCTNMTQATFDASFNTNNVTAMNAMFNNCTSLTSLNISNFTTENVDTMRNMFYGCNKLTNLDLSNFNTKKVTTMAYMFQNDASLNSISFGENFDASSCTTMSSMFYNCSSLTAIDLSSCTTPNVETMLGMFEGCSSLTSLNISNFDTSNVTTMDSMFQNCSSLAAIDISRFTTPNVRNMLSMFNNCSSLTSLDVSNFNTQNVETMKAMFASCTSLTTLDLTSFNTQKVTDMTYMFNMVDLSYDPKDSSLNTIIFGANFDPSACTNMANMFYNCNQLTTVQHRDSYNNLVEGIDNWNTSNVTNMTSMFENNEQLTTIGDVYANWDVTNVGSNHANFALNSLLTNIPDFTDSRLDASGTLFFQQSGSDVQYSTSVNGPWTDVSSSMWPITLTNTDSPSSTLNVTFITDLSLNALTQYFILDSSNITIDGSDNVVNINVDNYPGLVQNGTADTSGNSNITIRNLGVESTNTLASSGGWIGQTYFGNDASENYVENCYSTGDIGQYAGGIFGSASQGSISNCYSIGDITDNAGGIFGSGSQGTATNCYSIGDIGGFGGGIFGISSQASSSATNCYSTGDIYTNAGGIFGTVSSGSAAINCYSTGNYSSSGGSGIGVTDASYCYFTDGSTNWLDSNADASLNIASNAWTDIDLSSNTVPYLLSSFTSTLYSPSSATDASNSGISVVTDCSFSIVSVNGLNPSLYSPDITIDTDTGIIDFNSLQNGVYEVNVLATNTNTKDGYSFGTFTNNVTAIDASGSVLVKQDVGSNVEYSLDAGTNWTTAVWPVTLNNTYTANTLEVTFTTDLSLNSADQYFIIDSSNITIDGSSNVVNINVDSYPGLIQNGTSGSNGNSNITIQNLGVESSNSVADYGGWIGQQYFGRNATENYVENCYSTGTIGTGAGGIFGIVSEGTATNCYSTGDIGSQAGGIFGYISLGSAINCYSTGPINGGGGGIFGYQSQASASATNCYSTGPINGGGIFGIVSEGSATNCYSTGDISGNAGGIFGYFSRNGASATNCYSTGTIADGAGGIFGGSSISVSATNCYSIGTIGGGSAGGIFGSGSSVSATNCYSTNGSANWLDSNADTSLNVPGNYTDIDENSTNVPYRLSSFLNQQTLYDPSSGTDVNPEYPVDLSGSYTWSITSVNGSTTNNEGITINSSTGEIEFNVTSNGTYAVNVLAEDSFGKYSFETFTNIISNICFPAGTPIVTNQGIIPINKINPKIHTIRNKKIVAITKTVTPDKYLVRFEKDALGANLPCEATTMTQNHMLFYKGKMMKAKEFLHNELVTKVPYNGQVLYNVLLEEHDKMIVNNLICETLHPENYVAKMYHAFRALTPKQRVEMIKQVNKAVLTNDIYNKPSAKKFTFTVTK